MIIKQTNATKEKCFNKAITINYVYSLCKQSFIQHIFSMSVDRFEVKTNF